MSEKDNGGPAFPQFDVVAGERDGHGDAIEAYTVATGGMTLRDWFAGQAMAGLLANPQTGENSQAVIHAAFAAADAMLEARK